MKKSKRIAIGLTGIAGAAVMAAGMAMPANVFADTQQSAAVENGGRAIAYTNKIQVLDSDGKEIDNIKARVTSVLSDGTEITEDISSVDYVDWDESDPQNIIVGRRLPNKVLKVNLYEGKAEYTLHFTEVPEGYELPSDVVFSVECQDVDAEEYIPPRTELLSAEDVTAETGSGIHRIGMRKTGESVGATGWMPGEAVLAYDYYYYVGRDGQRYTGWHYMTEKEGVSSPAWMYFSKYYGTQYTGWVWMTSEEGEKIPHWSYFGEDGSLRTGWKKLGAGTADPDGDSAAHWSYFGDNGWLRTGWQKMGKGTSNPDGNAETHWSYFGSNGWLRTDWVQLGKGTSEPDGNNEKHWSYFGGNGWLRTGWQTLGAGTSDPDGNSPVHKSYFGDNGWLRTGNQTIDGRQYVFSDKGWLE